MFLIENRFELLTKFFKAIFLDLIEIKYFVWNKLEIKFRFQPGIKSSISNSPLFLHFLIDSFKSAMVV